MKILKRISKKFFLLFLWLFIFSNAHSQFFKVDTTSDINSLIHKKFISHTNQAIFTDNVHFYGQKGSLGYFHYSSTYNNLPSQGIILSSGSVLEAAGKNSITASTQNHFPGDSSLDKIVQNKTYDAAVLEFDFISLSDSISFSFQFASEEYPEYVGRGVSDIFGFFIERVRTNHIINIAKLPFLDIPITVDLINSTNNEGYYISNSLIDLENVHSNSNYIESSKLFRFDGYTTQIQTGCKLVPFETYHFKIVIADVGDRKFDSWVILHANSFSSVGKNINPSRTEIYNFLKFSQKKEFTLDSLQNQILITTPIYFEYNSWKFQQISLDFLKKISTIIRFSDYHIIINGFADESGTEAYNLSLSQKRADAVKNFFIKNGIPNERIGSVGKGEIKTAEPNDKSRKVEFLLFEKSSQ